MEYQAKVEEKADEAAHQGQEEVLERHLIASLTEDLSSRNESEDSKTRSLQESTPELYKDRADVEDVDKSDQKNELVELPDVKMNVKHRESLNLIEQNHHYHLPNAGEEQASEEINETDDEEENK